MFKKTAGVLILFAALLTLTISRVNARYGCVGNECVWLGSFECNPGFMSSNCNGQCDVNNSSVQCNPVPVLPIPTPTTTPNGSPETAPAVISTGGGGGTEAPASGCSDAPPGGAPVLLSAAAKGNNSAILTWTLAPDPVTYYLLTYGTASGVQTYGNPNVGGRDTKSYTVNNLSGGTSYYFRIRAGNGCAPGPYSNELSTKAGGIILTGPAAGFIPGVLGVKTQSSVVTPTPTPTPSPNPGQLEWIRTHKNVSGRIALILLANVYLFYLSNKKRNNF